MLLYFFVFPILYILVKLSALYIRFLMLIYEWMDLTNLSKKEFIAYFLLWSNFHLYNKYNLGFIVWTKNCFCYFYYENELANNHLQVHQFLWSSLLVVKRLIINQTIVQHLELSVYLVIHYQKANHITISLAVVILPQYICVLAECRL